MRDINIPLRKIYFDLLSTIGIPVYYMEKPDNCDDDEYIVFHTINSSDESTFSTSDTLTTVQVDAHYSAVKSVNSIRLDEICNQVLQLLKPAPGEHIEGDGIQITSTRVTNDVTDSPISLGGRKFATRRIVMEHGIFINFNQS